MKNWGEEFPVDVALDLARAEDYDALLLPGGVMSPDKLRMRPNAVEFVGSFFKGDEPVAAICHGPWTIRESVNARGRKITSWPSLKTDLKNAGASWFDEKMVSEGNLVSSRKPDDIPAFNKGMLELFKCKSKERIEATIAH
jgi:protease I